MKKFNYTSLVKLIFMSTLMVVLTACGGESTLNEEENSPIATWIPDTESPISIYKINEEISNSPTIKIFSKRVHINTVIYENAQDEKNSRWSTYTGGHEGTISNIDDGSKSSRVIELNGDATRTGYILGAWKKENGWKNRSNKNISWDMNFCENFVVYISVETEQGDRFITYSPLSDITFASNPNYGVGKKVHGGYTYIHLGLNPNTKGCSWQTISRDLEADLKRYEPNNSITFVNAFLVRGSGKFDNISMFDLGAEIDYSRDNVKEIVRDNITHLEWQDNEEFTTLVGEWDDAYLYCSELTMAGYSDWRLPSKDELVDLFNKDDRIFKFTKSSYWSDTRSTLHSYNAWSVSFSRDYGITMRDLHMYYYNYFRCVRVGE